MKKQLRKHLTLIFYVISCTPLLAQWVGTNPVYYTAGNVGIGTSTPTQKLEAVGPGSTSATPFIFRNDNNINSLSVFSGSATSTNYSGLNLNRSRGTYAAPTDALAGDWVGSVTAAPYISGGYRANASIEFYVGASPSATSYPEYILFKTTNTGTTARTERMRITEAGNVGIGTPTPGSLLDVAGTINATGLKITGGTPAAGKVLTSDAAGIATWQPTQWTASGSNVYFNTTGGAVGIGTATPSSSYKLDVGGTINVAGIFINGSPAVGGGSQWATSGANIYYNTTGGNVGIGTSNPGSFKLAVEGKIGAREVQVILTNPWPDYVFEREYKLPSLDEVQSYIDQNKHLPDMPSAKELEKNGVLLGEMNALLVKKIEELTLYMIELKKENKELISRIKIMEDQK
jgi:hypothetical protein